MHGSLLSTEPEVSSNKDEPLAECSTNMSIGNSQDGTGIFIHITPPEDEDADEHSKPPPTILRSRRTHSTPLNLEPEKNVTLSAFDSTKRRFSSLVVNATNSSVSRRLSATISWYLSTQAQLLPQIVREGRMLCLEVITFKIRRSSISSKKILLQRLKSMMETECGLETPRRTKGAYTAMISLCNTLERTYPGLFWQVARQAARAPSSLLRNESALTDFSLTLSKEICKNNVTWAKVAAVYSVCSSLAVEACMLSEGADSMLAPAAAISDLLQDDVGIWIVQHGGWNGIVDHCGVEKYESFSDRNMRVAIIIMSAMAILCVIVAFIKCFTERS